MAEDDIRKDLPADKLTKEDLELVKKRPVDVRSDAAKYIAVFYRNGELEGDQAGLAEDLFRNISEEEDDKTVKRSLTEQLKDCDNPAPHDIVMLLAEEDAEVSGPLLAGYKHFSKEEIQSFVEKKDNKKNVYIAKRSDLDAPTSTTLVNVDDPDVISALLSNKDSKIDEEEYAKIIKKFPEHEEVLSSLIGRDGTTDSNVVSVSQSTSSSVLKHLYEKHEAKFKRAHLEMEEKDGVLRLKLPVSKQTDIVFEKMSEEDIDIDLMPFLALCMGYVEIFEHVFFQGIQMEFADFYEKTKEEAGFNELYDKSDLMPPYKEASRIIYSTMRDIYNKETPIPREIYKKTKESCLEKLKDAPESSVFIDLINKAYDY